MKRRKKFQKCSFRPDSDYIKNAIDKFKAEGGKITVLEGTPDVFISNSTFYQCNQITFNKPFSRRYYEN